MDETLLEIREFIDPGYKPVIDFGEWRVAILNFLDEILPERIESMERHNETDEVFVMLRGQGILFLGEGETQIQKVHSQVMEPGKIYNVKRSVWHTVVLSQDGSVLIVENRNTNRDNSSYSLLNSYQRRTIIETSLREQEENNITHQAK
jgi:ureidoglycolate hydrolase